MKINDVAKQYDITPDALHYWERVEVIPAVHRTKAGYREYTRADIDWIFLSN